ncbi:RND transporter [Arachidicoccus ginsenosidimutans]|uniref:efflux RND transporter permease subunit n=1 Tax=Arachidicoccus sp. BS20 TaxID=1850526 RepID=UPI0007F17DE1|nr:efflux RND transporter permease subunit [Arachidicoccus sp. BS20]ANI89523.1 RND transporter [Arachidicoccus sp. BS20]
MWYSLGKFILKNRTILLIVLIASTVFMAYKASEVKMSYDFAKSIPTDNPKYIDYQNFLQQFGQDGNTMVVGISTDKLFTVDVFNRLNELQKNLRTCKGVTGVLSVSNTVNLIKNDSLQKFDAVNIFHAPYQNQNVLDSDKSAFLNLPFYRNLLYNPVTNAYLIAVTLDANVINSKARVSIIQGIEKPINEFEKQSGIKTYVSGLPYIRTVVSSKIAHELNWFLAGSFLLSAITLLLFFRSFSAMLMSLLVVAMGVVWSVGTMVLFGYKITLLTALIPPLIVVIGIPNCIYFLNKYHSVYKESNNKEASLVNMIGRMGVVTLFCNIAAAIGFAVFAFTSSDLLKEFGVVSGINIMMLFVISLIFIPSVLSFLPAPKPIQMRYLDNKTLTNVLLKIEKWTFHYTKFVYGITVLLIIFSVIGIVKMRSESHVVDDLPQSDKIYEDLKWFENNFNGVMPLDIVVDTKKKDGLFRNLKTIEKIDKFSAYMASQPNIAKPLSFVEALKFVRQSFYEGDSTYYGIPTDFDLPFMANYIKSLNSQSKNVAQSKSVLSSMLKSFIDTSKQKARISINMKDVGTLKLPEMLKNYQQKANEIFDTAHYKVTFTGTTITFLEGSTFIINGLKESIFWAFVLIAVAMLYLFRSARILLCSLIPNVIPLVVTAGVMGWVGISIKPSTVLVFSVALGIAIDVTIRFLVNYKQELPKYNDSVLETLKQTIRHTGISIIYTSLVLVAGFVIFCFSEFGGTKGLGWLTSLTLAIATLTNLVLLPVLIKSLSKKKSEP